MFSQSTTTQALLLSAILLASETGAFSSVSSSSSTPRSPSALNLLPDQANQLVAAFNAQSEASSQAVAPIAVSKSSKELEAAAEQPNSHWGVASTMAASKSLLSRIFQGPSVGHPLERKFRNNEDVCLYPMVGFRFIAGVEDALPTHSTGACAMPTKSQKDEEVFGWFSSSCKLDLFSDDVCHNPIVEESASLN